MVLFSVVALPFPIFLDNPCPRTLSKRVSLSGVRCMERNNNKVGILAVAGEPHYQSVGCHRSIWVFECTVVLLFPVTVAKLDKPELWHSRLSRDRREQCEKYGKL